MHVAALLTPMPAVAGGREFHALVREHGALRHAAPPPASRITSFRRFFNGRAVRKPGLLEKLFEGFHLSLLWTGFTGGAGGNSSAAVADGMLLFGSADHNVYAFMLDAGNSAAYRRNPRPPRFETLHPDFRLKPAKSANAGVR